jgi:hypothetical protein
LQRHIGKRYIDVLQAAGQVPVFRR